MENFDITQHRHNFAIWTAAAAVRRGFTLTSDENSDLLTFPEIHYILFD